MQYFREIVLMDSGAVSYNSEFNDQTVKATYRNGSLSENSRVSKFFEELPEKAREDFFNYLEQQGLVGETGMLVIPSNRHFFYDAEDMRKIKTVVSLKQLNHIREMKDFIKTIADLLPQSSNFIGCFIDNKAQSGFSDKYDNLPGQELEKSEAYENGIESRIPFINRMYSFIDSRTNRYLTRRSVKNLLEECGFQVVEMTNLHGMTYFYTQKKRPAA
jgi:hypothetical protein